LACWFSFCLTMIIFVREISNISSLNPTQEAALERLLWTYGRGIHVLWMPVDLVEELLTLTCFSSYAKRALYELKSAAVFSKNLLESEFNFRIVIDFSTRHALRLDRNELIAGYENALDERFLLEPVMLTENEIDAAIYQSFSNAFFSDRKNLRTSYTLKLEAQGGGGSDTVKKFARYLEEKRPLLCFIDSDKKHPKGCFGATSQHFNKYPKGLNAGYYLEILNVHEIENLIPVSLINLLYPDHSYGAIYNNPACRKYKGYPDHKKGLTVKDAKEQDETYQDNFWREFYHLEDNANLCGTFSNLIQKTKNYLEKTTPHKLRELLDDRLDAELYNISRTVTDWGISMRRTLS